MNSCTCIDAGKAKDADGYPSLYIWGRKTASQATGLYRSDDMGASWQRINDDQHQFGGPGNAQIVSGDMNEYGRVYMSTVGRGVGCAHPSWRVSLCMTGQAAHHRLFLSPLHRRASCQVQESAP